MHLVKSYGEKKFTAAADDWQISLAIKCQSINAARSIEKHIKRMKSSKFIQNLIQYPELINKLIDQYDKPGSPR